MYNIKITRHYYGPRDVKSYVMHPQYDGERMTYATKREALAAVKDAEPKELGSNESSYPTFTVIRAPASAAARVTRSRAKSIKDGARRIEVILRDPDSIASLDRLTDEHGSVTAAVTAVLKR